MRTFGGYGDGPGQFKTPHGLWLDNRPGREVQLVVADRANARLQYLTLEGKPVSMNHDVSFPAHFDIRGDVLLVPDLHARVSLFDKDNHVLVHLGHDPEWTKQVLDGFKIRSQPDRWPAGKFIHPHDACFDKDGNHLRRRVGRDRPRLVPASRQLRCQPRKSSGRVRVGSDPARTERPHPAAEWSTARIAGSISTSRASDGLMGVKSYGLLLASTVPRSTAPAGTRRSMPTVTHHRQRR